MLLRPGIIKNELNAILQKERQEAIRSERCLNLSFEIP